MSQSVTRIKQKLHYIEKDSTNIQALQGGNLLQINNTIVAGYNISYTNQINNRQTGGTRDISTVRSLLSNQLTNELGEPYIIWSGSDQAIFYPSSIPQYEEHQPIFHLDMYLTPSGIIKDDNYIVFAGSVDTHYYNPAYLDSLNRRQVINQLNKRLKETQNQLQIEFEQLKENNPDDQSIKKIKIIHVPLLVEFWDGTDSLHYYHSFNNVHIEIKQTEQNLYLPKYQRTEHIYYDAAQNKAKEIYKNEGFNVIEVNPYANRIGNGALHCYSKVIWRTPN